jgi:predicted small metal-binding protein
MRKVSDHVRKVHKVHTTTDTIANYVKLKVRGNG